MSTENALNNLKTKIWKTKGSRFNASRRLQTRKIWGGYLVSAFSIYILAIGIYSLTQEETSNQLNLLSIIGSLLILVFSLHEGSQNAEQKAERHHVCAKELTTLYDKVDFYIQTSKISDVENLIEEYSRIIERSAENHELIDYDMFRTEHKEFNITLLRKLYIEFEYYHFKTACLGMIATPLIALVVYSAINY